MEEFKVAAESTYNHNDVGNGDGIDVRNLAKLRQAKHHSYRKKTTCSEHRNRKPCNSFFMVKMASGMNCRSMHGLCDDNGNNTALAAGMQPWFTAYILV